MPREVIHIPNQGHTLGCLIRRALFENEASFASCIVPHPQDTSLKIELVHDDCKKCLLLALRDARAELESYLRVVSGRLVDKDMMDTDD